MSREIFPPRPEAERIFVLASSPSNRGGVCSGDLSKTDGSDSSCEAARASSIPVVPFNFRDGAIRFPKLASLTVCKIGNHGPIGDSWPIALLGYPRGHRVFIETECVRHTGLARRRILTLEPERLKEPD